MNEISYEKTRSNLLFRTTGPWQSQEKLSNGKGELAQKAKQMKKLINEESRLMEKGYRK